MRRIKLLLTAIFCLSLLMVVSCSSTRKAVASDGGAASLESKRSKSIPSTNGVELTENEQRSGTQLIDLLRRVSGVVVQGSGSNARVTIRGNSTFNASNEPLFVLDGTPIGHDFSAIASAINAREVKSIYVLKGADAAIYGTQGGNGVIMITSIK